jgi:hypothetical protein
MNTHLPITGLWGGGVVAMAPFEDQRMGAIGAKDMDHATGWRHVSSGGGGGTRNTHGKNLCYFAPVDW